MKRIILTLMVVIVLVSGTCPVLMAKDGPQDTINEYIRQINRWTLIKSNRDYVVYSFRSTKEFYDKAVKERDPDLQAAKDEYNLIRTRRIIAVGESNAAHCDMMYANRMLESLSNRSPSEVPPGAVDYWTGKRNEARDRYNRYSAEVPMIEAELKPVKKELDRLQGIMDNLISERDEAETSEKYYQGKSDEAQAEIDRLQGLIDALLPDPDRYEK